MYAATIDCGSISSPFPYLLIGTGSIALFHRCAAGALFFGSQPKQTRQQRKPDDQACGKGLAAALKLTFRIATCALRSGHGIYPH